jgi:hypothetical protein
MRLSAASGRPECVIFSLMVPPQDSRTLPVYIVRMSKGSILILDTNTVQVESLPKKCSYPLTPFLIICEHIEAASIDVGSAIEKRPHGLVISYSH